MKNTQIPQRARLMGLHNRWHVKKGRIVATCDFCKEPNVKNTVGKELELAPQVKFPATIEQDETDRQLEEFKIKAHFRDTVWSSAQTGLSILEAARCAKLELIMFAPAVEAEFKETYQDLVETARLDNLRSITLAALQAAKAGDVKLLLRLEERGIFSNWLRQEKDKAESLKSISIQELEERIRSYFIPRQAYTNLDSTISIEDTTPEETKAFEQQGSIEATKQESIPAVEIARPEKEIVKEVERDQQPSPTAISEEPAVTEQGPVIYTPPEAASLTLNRKYYD